MDSFIDVFDVNEISQDDLQDIERSVEQTIVDRITADCVRQEIIGKNLTSKSEKDINAFFCHDCRRWSKSKEYSCVQRRHRVENRFTKLRFFQCGRKTCTYTHGVIAVLYPTRNCPKCGFAGWKKAETSPSEIHHFDEVSVPTDYLDVNSAID